MWYPLFPLYRLYGTIFSADVVLFLCTLSSIIFLWKNNLIKTNLAFYNSLCICVKLLPNGKCLKIRYSFHNFCILLLRCVKKVAPVKLNIGAVIFNKIRLLLWTVAFIAMMVNCLFCLVMSVCSGMTQISFRFSFFNVVLVGVP